MGEGAANSEGLGWAGPVRVVRSTRRRSTVSARVVDGTLELKVPARLSRQEETYWIDRLGRRLLRRSGGSPIGDEALLKRAQELNRQYFGGRLDWKSITFSSVQQRRWGSCSPVDGTIRIAERARRLPAWVLDYLLVHELAHLVHDDHGAQFWELVRTYRLTERARGYLMAVDDQAGDPGQQVLPY